MRGTTSDQGRPDGVAVYETTAGGIAQRVASQADAPGNASNDIGFRVVLRWK